MAGNHHMHKKVAVIIGHSFPKSLNNHIYHKYMTVDARDQSPYPKYVAKFLEVSDKYSQVHLFGDGGATALDTFSLPSSSTLTQLRPEVACIDLGSNDIINGYNAKDTAYEIISIAEILRDLFHCREIRIFSVLNRSVKPTDIVSQSQFDHSQYELNGYLAYACSRLPQLTYHVHTGFWQTADSAPLFINEWSKDSIHPNLKLGRKNYIRSIRSALLHGYRDADRYQ